MYTTELCLKKIVLINEAKIKKKASLIYFKNFFFFLFSTPEYVFADQVPHWAFDLLVTQGVDHGISQGEDDCMEDSNNFFHWDSLEG